MCLLLFSWRLSKLLTLLPSLALAWWCSLVLRTGRGMILITLAFQSSLLLAKHICYSAGLLTVMLLKQFSNTMNWDIPVFKELACMGSCYFVLSLC